MLNPTALATLRAFRRELYQDLGRRQDSLFELVEAVLTAPERRTLVQLSLCPCFRRRWPSTCDALADATVDVRAQLAAHVPPGGDQRPLWVLAGTPWPRPAAATTSPARTWEHRPLPGKPQQGVVPAWAYHWLVMVPEAGGTWVLSVAARRRDPTAGTSPQVASAQIGTTRAHQPAAPRPVVALDSGYDVAQLAQAEVDADLVVRLAKSRVFRRAPGPYAGRGRPHKHGPVFKLDDAHSHGPADHAASLEHPPYGTVTVDTWSTRHVQGAAAAPVTVVPVQVEHLPRHGPPAPLWLAWIGGPLLDDLHQLWRWCRRRFTVEHAFRFAKHSLGWTTVRPRHPAAADRWSWLVAAVFWQLWLARPLVADQRLPWERPRPAERLSPGRVQRAFGGL